MFKLCETGKPLTPYLRADKFPFVEKNKHKTPHLRCGSDELHACIKISRNINAACDSGAFLVKSLCNMIKGSGGVNTKKASDIKKRNFLALSLT